MGLNGSTKAIQKIKLPKGLPRKLALAWSGGADSTALLHLLIDHGYDIIVWHIDHGWHTDSRQQSEDLKEKAETLGVSFYVKRLRKPKKNLEAQARDDRFAAFESLAYETGCTDLLLAHHADDQAETVCMRMLQGAGVAGCQGMREQRQHGALTIWRPLIQVSRKSIERYLEGRGLGWLEDPSNQSCMLWRNKIRLQVFPAIQRETVNPKLLFLRWQKQARRVQAQIESLASHIDIRLASVDGVSFCETNWAEWVDLDKPIRLFLLQKMIKRLLGEQKVFGRRHLLAIEKWKEHGGNGWLNLSGCCLYRQGQSLQLCEGNTSLRSSVAQKRLS